MGGVAHLVWDVAPLGQALQAAAVFSFALSFSNEFSERVALADPYLDVWTELIVAAYSFLHSFLELSMSSVISLYSIYSISETSLLAGKLACLSTASSLAKTLFL